MAFCMSGPAAALMKMGRLSPVTSVIEVFLRANPGRNFSTQQLGVALRPVLTVLLAPVLATYPTFSIDTFTGAAAAELARNNPHIFHTRSGKTHFFRA